jgi:hypothetical protein
MDNDQTENVSPAQRISDKLHEIGYIYASIGVMPVRPEFLRLREELKDFGYLISAYELAGQPDKRVLQFFGDPGGPSMTNLVFQNHNRDGWTVSGVLNGDEFLDGDTALSFRGDVDPFLVRFYNTTYASFHPRGCTFLLEPELSDANQQVFGSFARDKDYCFDRIRLRIANKCVDGDYKVVIEESSFLKNISRKSDRWDHLLTTSVTQLLANPKNACDVITGVVAPQCNPALPQTPLQWLKRQFS